MQTLHYPGFVVPDVTAGLNGFVRSMVAKWGGRVYENPHQKVKVAFLIIRPGDPLIELGKAGSGRFSGTTFSDGTRRWFASWLLWVVDVEHQMAAMKARRYLLIHRPMASVAFDGRRIAGMLSAEHLLVKLLEKGHEPIP